MGYGIRLWVMGYGLWVVVYGVMGCGLWGYGLWFMGLWVRVYGLGVMGYRLWVMGYGLWVMGYGLGCGLRFGLGVVCGSGLALCVVTCEKDSRMQKSWRSNPPSLAQFQGSRISDQIRQR
jgi:hypothetical protein